MAGIAKFRYCCPGSFFDNRRYSTDNGFFVQKYHACHLQHVFLTWANNESKREEVVCPESDWR
jgi:hypothetical protein